MGLQRASHCIYDIKYHLVWAPKYRKWVLDGPIRTRVQEVFQEIARHHGFEITEMEVDKDHVHLFLSFPPKYSIARVVEVFKSVRGKRNFIFQFYWPIHLDVESIANKVLRLSRKRTAV